MRCILDPAAVGRSNSNLQTRVRTHMTKHGVKGITTRTSTDPLPSSRNWQRTHHFQFGLTWTDSPLESISPTVADSNLDPAPIEPRVYETNELAVGSKLARLQSLVT